jgi:IPT/TIG domain
MTGLKRILFASLLGGLALGLCIPTADAKTSAHATVAASPACDLQAHPKITKVTPDTVKAGQRITIKGNKFGTKECFQNISFGSVEIKEFTYVNDTTLEATVPSLKPGLVPVNVLTAGGTAQFMVLVQK